MRILIAINENKGMESKLSEHFGHCPYFGIYETKTKKLEILKNDLNHADSFKSPVDQIMKFKPNVIFSLGMGERAIKLFNEKSIKLKSGNHKTAREVIENLDNLKELNSGCSH